MSEEARRLIAEVLEKRETLLHKDPTTLEAWELFKAILGDLPTLCDHLEASLQREAELTAVLHANEMHPDYEYETTTGPLKVSYDFSPPEGDGWEKNIYRDQDGWERFDYHEEAYWMRRKPRGG